MSNPAHAFQRPQRHILSERLTEPRRLIQFVGGPRQVGKTTLVRQVLDRAQVPFRYVTADEPSGRDTTWIAAQWERARALLAGDGAAILVIDEVQKIAGWSETVKRLWDGDT